MTRSSLSMLTSFIPIAKFSSWKAQEASCNRNKGSRLERRQYGYPRS
jgi:hypothetical protein